MTFFALSTIIIISIVVFLAVILGLVTILLQAKARLMPSGPVTLDINGDAIEIESGSTVLNTLNSQKVFLPSACGGGGTCGMCKCQVTDGGGAILPTEVGYFNRKEIADNWRLACQVKIKNDMKIVVPAEVFGIKKWECEVVSNYNVASFIKEFVVRLPEGQSLDFEAGGYIQIDVPETTVDFKNLDITAHPKLGKKPDEFQAEWDKFGLWDLTMKNPEPIYRAYSMANHPAEGNIVILNIRIATPPWDREKNGWMDVNPGICSSFVFDQKAGDKVTISGPYGDFFIKESEAEMIYIGGGAGMAPMRSHLFHLFHTLKSGRKVSYWYGGRSRRELFYIDDFKKIEAEFPNFTFNMVLSEPMEDDNWQVKAGIGQAGDGFKGFVHQALIDNYLNDHDAPEDIEFYFCGPPMMNAAVLKMVDDFGVPSENVAWDDFGG